MVACGTLERLATPVPAWAYPCVQEPSLDPCMEPPLSQHGWEVIGALRRGKVQGHTAVRGAEEAVGKADGTAHFRQRWHMRSYLYICACLFHGKFSKKQ